MVLKFYLFQDGLIQNHKYRTIKHNRGPRNKYSAMANTFFSKICKRKVYTGKYNLLKMVQVKYISFHTKKKFCLHLFHCTKKINVMLITYLHLKSELLRLLEENVANKIQVIGIGKDLNKI